MVENPDGLLKKKKKIFFFQIQPLLNEKNSRIKTEINLKFEFIAAVNRLAENQIFVNIFLKKREIKSNKYGNVVKPSVTHPPLIPPVPMSPEKDRR